jgi:DoxX-like family
MRVDMVVDSMARLGVPESELFGLGALKVAGAAGLLVGIGVHPHPPTDGFLLLAVGSLALRLATA